LVLLQIYIKKAKRRDAFRMKYYALVVETLDGFPSLAVDFRHVLNLLFLCSWDFLRRLLKGRVQTAIRCTVRYILCLPCHYQREMFLSLHFYSLVPGTAWCYCKRSFHLLRLIFLPRFILAAVRHSFFFVIDSCSSREHLNYAQLILVHSLFNLIQGNRRFTEITHDPLLCSVAQGIF
jgi:hypothetical protein